MGNALQAGQREVRLVPVLPVILLKLIQVGSQQLAHKEQMLLKEGDYAGQEKSHCMLVQQQTFCWSAAAAAAAADQCRFTGLIA